MFANPLEHSISFDVFARCILRHVWPDSVELNQILRDQILAKEKEETGLDLTNLGGWHSMMDLQHWRGEAAGTIIERATLMANELTRRTCQVDGSDFAAGWKIWGWANVNRKGDRNVWHRHISGKSHWSGVYYVDVGSIATNTDAGGDIVFMDQYQPRPINRDADFDVLSIRPEPALMLLFPSALLHKVQPYNGDGARISIAFNLRHPGLTVPHYELEELRESRETIAKNKSQRKSRPAPRRS